MDKLVGLSNNLRRGKYMNRFIKANHNVNERAMTVRAC